MCDVCYAINLDRRPERWALLAQRLPADWELPEVRRFPAIDGRTLPCDRTVTPGTLGCLASHRAVLERVARKARTALIFEDDVIFRPDFCRQFAELMRIVPAGWHQVYLGGNHRRPPRRIAPGLLRCAYTTATHAYLVSPSGAARLLASLDGWSGHVDQAYGRMHAAGTVEAYAPERWLCGQAGGTSDVLGFNRPARVPESYYDFEGLYEGETARTLNPTEAA